MDSIAADKHLFDVGTSAEVGQGCDGMSTAGEINEPFSS